MKGKPLALFVSLFLLSFYCNAQYSQMTDSLLRVYETHDNDSLRVRTLGFLFQAHLYNDREKAKEYIYQKLEISLNNNFELEIARTYFHLGNFYIGSNEYDSALHYYQLANEKFTEIDHFKGKLWALNGIAIVHYDQGDYIKSIELTDRGIEALLDKVKKGATTRDSIDLAVSYDFRGSIETRRGSYRIALENTLQALSYLKNINKPIRKADALSHLAEIEGNLGHHDKSLEHAMEAYNIYKKYNDKAYQANVANDIGLTYYILKNFSASEKFLKESIDLSNEMSAQATKGTALTNLGKLYMAQDEYTKALSALDSSLIIHERISVKNKIAEALIELGALYHKLNSPNKALPYLDRAILISDSLDAKETLKQAYFHRSESYALLGNHIQALADYQQFQMLGDSIYSIEQSNQIEELRSIYETERKEAQIDLQNKEILLLEQTAKADNMQKWLLSIGLVMAVIILLLAFYGFRQKIKRNQLTREKLDAELALKSKKLTSHALLLAKKNEVLEDLKEKVKKLKNSPGNGNVGYQTIINTINSDILDNQNWENFTKYFEEVHTDFNATVKKKFPKVTSNELRLMALLKMGLSSKEIANILNVSQEGVKKSRYRLRKKLEMQSEESLQDLVISI
ncbi:tetratricopeptide repeat protein [Fulvivirga sp. RKSG066]|uniref:tetratricopeptide repeat protein n=1 Tax=Fulvivirga aurantia TaxID=2529383 RepID=UPI0012BCD33F|nr:tetratricopeptide repeat protein [Fulvivirga aurantia]MTI22033.1 tetratricopeptide repeat protein [Fulvivirga aurantia]